MSRGNPVSMAGFIFFICGLFLPPGAVFASGKQADTEAKYYYDRGKRYYEKRQYKKAREEFQKAVILSSQKDKVKGREKQDTGDSSDIKIKEYIIGEDDVLYISVWQNNDLNQEVTVRPDGRISFPLAGDVMSSGITIPGLSRQLTQLLKEYIKNPVVTVSLKKIGGRKVVVLGEVFEPGVYTLSGKETVLEKIASIGGFNDDAVLSSVILIRGGVDKPEGMRLNLNRALMKTDMKQNILLEPQDIIYVPKKFIANVNYFVTQILGPMVQGAGSYQGVAVIGKSKSKSQGQ